MKLKYCKIFCLMLVAIFVISTSAIGFKIKTSDLEKTIKTEEIGPLSLDDTDIDPLVDLEVTVKIKEIRALDTIDKYSEPDFYVKVFIDDEVFISPTWKNQKYITDENEIWNATKNVDDFEKDYVIIRIQLWDSNPIFDRLCDLSQNVAQTFTEEKDVLLNYSLKTGHWNGEDFITPQPTYFDRSGYGRLNGCDDNSVYKNDKDCELLFDITQTDPDGDGIPYWTEVEKFHTDPEEDDTGSDNDSDGIPIEWEFKWGYYMSYHYNSGPTYNWFYDPNEWNDHKNIDLDDDGLNNYEEYLTSQWGSDPFRKDLFIEIDQMNGTDDIPPSLLPKKSIELLTLAHHRQNIVYHIDDGCMGGSDMLPFDESIEREELPDLFKEYFLHGDEDNWRRGVFHYGLICYEAGYAGYAYGPGVGGYNGAFQLSSNRVKKYYEGFLTKDKATAYASVFMHETGHTLGLNGLLIGGHNRDSYHPWQINFWKWRPYKSCMNYGYCYRLVDFSDGSHGKNDFDDWENINLGLFQENLQ